MKPPYCFLCHRDFHLDKGGDLVRFADYVPLAEGMIGHPSGSEWFCPEHLSAANALAFKTSSEALHDLQREYGEFPPLPFFGPGPHREPTVLFVGALMHKIVGIVRKITGRSPPKDK